VLFYHNISFLELFGVAVLSFFYSPALPFVGAMYSYDWLSEGQASSFNIAEVFTVSLLIAATLLLSFGTCGIAPGLPVASFLLMCVSKYVWSRVSRNFQSQWVKEISDLGLYNVTISRLLFLAG